MNVITDKNSTTPARQSDSASCQIGIYIKLPSFAFWLLGGVETEMLTRQISGALQRRKILAGNVTFVVFDRQVFGMASVTSLGMALSTVADELSAVQLIDGAHLAWRDESEGIWRTDRPLPEPVPFQSRVESYLAWSEALKAQTEESRAAEAAKIIAQILMITTRIASRHGETTQPGKETR